MSVFLSRCMSTHLYLCPSRMNYLHSSVVMWGSSGRNTYPVLFSLFLNDLEEYLFEKENNGILAGSSSEGFVIFLKRAVLLYAGDTAILSEDPHAFLKWLHGFRDYSDA